MRVNPNDAPEWYVAVEASSEHKQCSSCAFHMQSTSFCLKLPACTRESRDDGHNVVFIKKDGE